METQSQYPHAENSVNYWKTRHKLAAEKIRRLEASKLELLTSLDECLEVVAGCCNCLLNTSELARATAAIAKERGQS